MNRRLIASAVGMALVGRALVGMGLMGCAADAPEGTMSDAASSDSTLGGVDAPTLPLDTNGGDELSAADVATADTPMSGGWTEASATVSQTARGLSMGVERLVWEEDGAIRMYDRDTAAVVTVLAADPAVTRREPALAGAAEDRVVFSEARGGDADLYVLELASGDVSPLVVGPGDQHAVAADGDVVVWLDQPTDVVAGEPAAPPDRRRAEVYALDLSGGTPRALTEDDAEQTFPSVRGRRVVFADFGRDPDKQALVDADVVFDVNADNGDIVAVDLPDDAGPLAPRWVVTDDPAKQTRPAIDGDTVVWLDWRGISPEPKYQLFKIFTRTGAGPELELGRTGWSRAGLWQRPAVRAGTVAWIAEAGSDGLTPGVPGAPFLAVSRADGSGYQTVSPVPAGQPSLNLVGVGLSDGGIGWLGGGRLGVRPLSF